MSKLAHPRRRRQPVHGWVGARAQWDFQEVEEDNALVVGVMVREKPLQLSKFQNTTVRLFAADWGSLPVDSIKKKKRKKEAVACCPGLLWESNLGRQNVQFPLTVGQDGSSHFLTWPLPSPNIGGMELLSSSSLSLSSVLCRRGLLYLS